LLILIFCFLDKNENIFLSTEQLHEVKLIYVETASFRETSSSRRKKRQITQISDMRIASM